MEFPPYEHLITPSDRALIRSARKRGEAAVDRLAAAIARRVGATARERDAVRQALMSDLDDHAWPPQFLQEPR